MTIDDTSGNNLTAVSGTLDISFSEVTTNSYLLTMVIDNTSNEGIGGAAFDDVRMTGFALDILGSSSITGSTVSTGWTAQTNGNGTLPGEPLAFDACFYSGANCGAGGTVGLNADAGTLAGFSLSISDASFIDLAAFETAFTNAYDAGTLNACMRFISIPEQGEGSGNGAGSDVACLGGETTDIPEPSIIALFGLGLVGLGFARRRQS
jgi:hypothetical protein